MNHINPEILDDPTAKISLEDLQRTIIADKPRIFKIPIDWGIDGHGYEYPSEEEEKNAQEDYNHHFRAQLIQELHTNKMDENSSMLSNFNAANDNIAHGGMHDPSKY